ncbi:MAG: DUF4837 family protein [Candidatus Marinimicrobia bacterium]|nr:DUF4837 family protein [Candidatus Neomarinimicrobiota bacterium]MBT5760067.1 DUF4837 family protein [Candidatus Neomarinimicrobiota bacterium]MBT7277218.1 DUF4837 family protein [Candidatus Neomarinimicrobiota bacterium]
MKKLPFLIFIIFLVFLSSCDLKREALGSDNDIRVICSEIDKPIIQKYLKSIFTDTLFNPEPEPYYHLKFSDISTYNALKEQSQVIVGAVLRDPGNAGYQLMKKILPQDQFESMEMDDPIILAKNVHANKQLFMIINASTKDQLMATVPSKKNFIRKQFFDQFEDRQSRYIFGDDRNKLLEDSLNTEFGWSIKIPWGWQRLRAGPDSKFVWLGKEMPFQWIGISWENGKLVDDELRAGDFIWSWPKAHYGNIQFHEYKFDLKKISFGNTNAYRANGIWETIELKESKGGPFRSYVFYDEKNDRTYHLNYLIHHPGNEKTLFMRQMDLIVKTFTVSK